MTRPVARYHFELTCPLCRGVLERVAEGTPGFDSRAIARCEPCDRLWGLTVTIADVTDEVDRSAEQAERKAAYNQEWRRRQKAAEVVGEDGERAA